MILNNRIGVLLVNLGTPRSPKPKDVRRYLLEFLTDKRVIDLPFIPRQLLVRGVIVPRRYKESARAFQRVWGKEGSPLLLHSRRASERLGDLLGSDYQVELAMRYQHPSLEEGLERLRGAHKLIVLPLFPQYASATTGSVIEKVTSILSRWQVSPDVSFISQFATHPAFIEAHCAIGRRYRLTEYDQILFSFHGLPERHIRKADPTGTCLTRTCCKTPKSFCYASQCQATMRAICDNLNVPNEQASLCYQSRLGKDPWIRPYTQETVDRLLQEGKKRLLVFSPAFVCDCLETLDEIGVELRNQFLKGGGEALDLVPGLNDEPAWIDALATIVRSRGNSHVAAASSSV